VERGLLRGVAILRTVALALTIGVVASERHLLVHPVVAWLLLCLATVLTAVTLWCSIVRPEALVSVALVSVELVLGATLLLADGYVFRTGHVGSNQGGLIGSWPIAGVLTAGIAFGPWAGLSAGAGLGVAHLLAAPINGVSLASLSSTEVLGYVSSFVLYCITGLAAGYAVRLARAYDDTMAFSRAREEMARVVHDGVLQTLALIPRRTSDPELIRLAREQDRELRRFFLDAPSTLAATARASRRSGRLTPTELDSRLRTAAARHLDVLVPEDAPTLDARRGDALVGACSEALANVAKHAAAHRVTVFVEPLGRTAVFCSVKDDGTGFDTAAATTGMGIRTSIASRIEGVGGRVELVSQPGHGTEVRLWV
jgi:signal transduction histidine kinase